MNFGSHKDEISILEKQNIEWDHKNFLAKSSDIKSYAKNGLSGYTSQDGLFASNCLDF